MFLSASTVGHSLYFKSLSGHLLDHFHERWILLEVVIVLSDELLEDLVLCLFLVLLLSHRVAPTTLSMLSGSGFMH